RVTNWKCCLMPLFSLGMITHSRGITWDPIHLSECCESKDLPHQVFGAVAGECGWAPRRDTPSLTLPTQPCLGVQLNA
ncbi:hypothetical protein PIB30_103174, partial [Stylosanthes scabra]|nr:hypothetical protein [Stylosanthes scabra]